MSIIMVALSHYCCRTTLQCQCHAGSQSSGSNRAIGSVCLCVSVPTITLLSNEMKTAQCRYRRHLAAPLRRPLCQLPSHFSMSRLHAQPIKRRFYRPMGLLWQRNVTYHLTEFRVEEKIKTACWFIQRCRCVERVCLYVCVSAQIPL